MTDLGKMLDRMIEFGDIHLQREKIKMNTALLADAIIGLINASPRSPRKDELMSLIASHLMRDASTNGPQMTAEEVKRRMLPGASMAKPRKQRLGLIPVGLAIGFSVPVEELHVHPGYHIPIRWHLRPGEHIRIGFCPAGLQIEHFGP